MMRIISRGTRAILLLSHSGQRNSMPLEDTPTISRMRRLLLLLAFVFALPLFALGPDDCRAYSQLAALYQVRGLMLKSNTSSYDVDNFIDHQIDELRGPEAGGGFRWVRWMKPSGSNGPEVKKGHRAVGVHDRGERDPFEASGDHGFAVRIEVPEKKTAFSKNNRVFVGDVTIRYDDNGRSRTMQKTIGEWMNPDTSRTFDIETIADRVDVSIDSGADADKVREALVEIHILQAVADDDPENPAFDAIQSLKRVRRATDERYAIDDEIAHLESSLYPHGESLPIAQIIGDLRRADELIHSSKEKERDRGADLLRETMRRLN
jgi:hypothetical protein